MLQYKSLWDQDYKIIESWLMYIGLNLTNYTPCYRTTAYHLWILEYTAESIDRAEMTAFSCVCVCMCLWIMSRECHSLKLVAAVLRLIRLKYQLF